MKKWMAMLMLGASMLVVASGCGNESLKTTDQLSGNEVVKETPQTSEEAPTVTPEETPIQIDNKKETINAVTDVNYLEGLNRCSSYVLELQDENIAVELYVSAQVDPSGELVLDDGQEWALVARIGDEIYPLVERTYVQNGEVDYTVYTDYEQNEMPHILARNSSGAGISYYDCTYDAASKTLSRETVFAAENINVLYKF